MGRPAKYVTLRGKRKKLIARCECGRAKKLEARKGKKGWRICGASEETVDSRAP